MKTIYHVQSHSDENWQVKREGAEQATKTFSTKEDAYQFGRELCDSNRPSELIVHRLDGEIEDKSLYND
ncbi:DUF2188 domain-containing protein [Guptibacillus algicola]|uniref:DUF2188 domain-containing protein n=1 Tax=Guptibacillus algicola TaxID=225844 RepID=UPI001CD3E8BB|nr:DUF2188 domain-containing protein [Alkalihalobacillus algicola]MCA0987713.1 DUF2188 domain-containing protein [Alkalihalobacillus algicola]